MISQILACHHAETLRQPKTAKELAQEWDVSERHVAVIIYRMRHFYGLPITTYGGAPGYPARYSCNISTREPNEPATSR
jgi:hypothetical protein